MNDDTEKVTSDNDNSTFKAGDHVRLKADPGRVGVVTGRTMMRGGITRWQISFFDGNKEYHKSVHLELVSDNDDDPLELLREGRLGRARDLRGAITHIRLTGKLADLIYSMDTTNTDFYPYQFKPVLNFLNSPAGGLLVADEVGLGKTIEAGLIWTELRARFDIRRVMVLCPAMLREKWQDELSYRFGIKADILKPKEVMEHLKKYIRDESYDYAMVCSMQGLRPRRGWNHDEKKRMDAASQLSRFLDENAFKESLFDLLIIDEAHYLRNPESMTSKLGRLLRAISEYVVLLSATPIHIKNNNLYQLLNLVDENTFNVADDFDNILNANEPILRARDEILTNSIDHDTLKNTLLEASVHPYMASNRQLADMIDSLPTDDELCEPMVRTEVANRLESINLLSRTVNRTRKRDVHEWQVLREPVPEIIGMTETERRFYEKVTEVVRDYAINNEGHEGFLLVTPQRQMTSCMPAALQTWLHKGGILTEQVYEDLGLDPHKGNLGPLTEALVSESGNMGTVADLEANDSKYARLRKMLLRYLDKHPTEKIVLFSYFRPTLKYLQKKLSSDGIKSIVLMGGQKIDKYESIKKFKNPNGPNVLLSSEVASEGVDLQFSRLLVNYDLPWNPMKVEQRIGRIDRIGQKADKITIWNLFYADTIDERIYTRLYQRLEIFKRALGDLDAVLGDEIRELTEYLLFNKLSPAQEEKRINKTVQAIANVRDLEEKLEQEASNLVAHGDYILNQIKAAREMQRTINSEDLWNYTYDYFAREYTGSEFRQLDGGEYQYEIKLSDRAKFDITKFIESKKLHGKTKLGSAYPRKVVSQFRNQVDTVAPGNVEIINQFHPLIRFVSTMINESGYTYYSPVSVELDADEVLGIEGGPYVFMVEQWSVKGLRDIEKINAVAYHIPSKKYLSGSVAERIVTVAARVGKDWANPASECDFSFTAEMADKCFEISESDFDQYVKRLDQENNDRADIQEQSLRRHHERQLSTLTELISRYRAEGRERLIPPTQGRIDALNGRVNQKLMAIREGRNLKPSKKEVCVGLINVT